MTQQRLPIEHSLPSTLGEAHEMIRDLLRLHENAEKRQVEIQEHFQKQLTRVKKLFKIAVTRIYGSSSEASKALFNGAESVTSELPSAELEETLPFCTGSEDDSAKPSDRSPWEGKTGCFPKPSEALTPVLAFTP